MSLGKDNGLISEVAMNRGGGKYDGFRRTGLMGAQAQYHFDCRRSRPYCVSQPSTKGAFHYSLWPFRIRPNKRGEIKKTVHVKKSRDEDMG